MLLRPNNYQEIDPKKRRKTELELYGIKSAARTLYLFVDREKYYNRTLTVGKAIQINAAAQAGIKNSGSIPMGSHMNTNSSLIKLNVYVYDVVFGPEQINDLRGAIFTLSEAYGTEIYSDFDIKDVFRPEIGLYNKLIPSKGDNMGSSLYHSMNNVADIPIPKYYTTIQQMKEEGDIYSIVWIDYTQTYTGEELCDDITLIDLKDLSAWDTMKPYLTGQRKELVLDTIPSGTNSIITDLFSPSAESMVHGLNFLYDSRLGKRYFGRKEDNVCIPLSKYRIPETIKDDMDHILSVVEMKGHELEKKHGNVRLHYVPLLQGDALRVYFDDYNIKPVDFNNAKVDRSLPVTETLCEIMEESKMFNSLGDDGACYSDLT